MRKNGLKKVDSRQIVVIFGACFVKEAIVRNMRLHVQRVIQLFFELMTAEEDKENNNTTEALECE